MKLESAAYRLRKLSINTRDMQWDGFGLGFGLGSFRFGGE